MLLVTSDLQTRCDFKEHSEKGTTVDSRSRLKASSQRRAVAYLVRSLVAALVGVSLTNGQKR